MRICPQHSRRMVVRQRHGWKYFACPVEGCDFIRAFKWQRMPKRRAAQALAKPFTVDGDSLGAAVKVGR